MNKLYLYTVIFSMIIIFTVKTMAYEKSDTFFVSVHDKKVKVLAPYKFRRNLSVIIENRMVEKLVGKVVKNDGTLIGHVSVATGRSSAVKVQLKKNERLFFIPLSPSFQEVELVIGKKSYEIPPKR